MSNTVGTDTQLRRPAPEEVDLAVFNNQGCFTAAELEVIRSESRKPIDQIPVQLIRAIIKRLDQRNQTPNCPPILAQDAEALSSFFCLTTAELENIRSDAQKLPDSLRLQRIDQIIERISQSRNSGCEITIQDAALFNKFVFLLEIERSLQTPQSCFPPRQVNDIIATVRGTMNQFTDPELAFLIRSIQRNNAKAEKAIAEKDTVALQQGNCDPFLDQKQLFDNLLIALKLERERRLAAGVPKTVEQRTRLDILSEEATIRRQLETTKAKLPNQTLNQISINLSETVLGVMEDLLNPPENVPLVDHLIRTFTKESRPVYLGIILIAISLFVALFRNIA